MIRWKIFSREEGRGAVTGTRLWNWGWVTTRSLRVFCSRPFFRIGGDRFRPDGNNEVITVARSREDISWIFMEESRTSILGFRIFLLRLCFSLLNIYLPLYSFFRSYAYFTFFSPASLSNIYLLLHSFTSPSLSLSLSRFAQLLSFPLLFFFHVLYLSSLLSPRFPPFTFPLYFLSFFAPFFFSRFLYIYISFSLSFCEYKVGLEW